jgi:hypothetical protein
MIDYITDYPIGDTFQSGIQPLALSLLHNASHPPSESALAPAFASSPLSSPPWIFTIPNYLLGNTTSAIAILDKIVDPTNNLHETPSNYASEWIHPKSTSRSSRI